MSQYIDKSALVAEIENLENEYKKCPTRNSYEEGLKTGILIGYKDALHKINTLEVKEVDFETAFAALIDHFDEKNNYGQWPESDLREFAEHFFELGLKAQKGK